MALTDPDLLRVFFLAVLDPVADADAAKEDKGRAWLRLTQVFSQDGFFTFSEPVVGLITSQAAGGMVIGKTVVTEGGTGSIHVALEFDEGGRLTDVMEVRDVQAGERPI